MSYPTRYAVLMDGAFLIRKLQRRMKAFPSARDIEAVAREIARHECLAELSRLRIYFYHAHPAAGVVTNPISKAQLRLATTSVFTRNQGLLDALVGRPDFALRLGETSMRGWQLGRRSFEKLIASPRAIEADDLMPLIEQKGVDLRIGLDIARLSLSRAVQAIVVVTGDSDLAPAFKFARREGLRVFLCHLGHGIKRVLREHADRIIEIPSVPMVPAASELWREGHADQPRHYELS